MFYIYFTSSYVISEMFTESVDVFLEFFVILVITATMLHHVYDLYLRNKSEVKKNKQT
jgi:hypothetical protein